MFAKELVGKTCIRETPVMKERYIQDSSLLFSNGERLIKEADYTYCTKPVKIIAATDHNIVIEEQKLPGKSFSTVLDERYCDDAWVDYNDIVGDCKPESEDVACERSATQI